MKTYLMVWFNSNGPAPTNIIQRLTSMGFNPMKGQYDFEYSWRKTPTLDEIFSFIDEVHQTLKGTNVLFKVESV